MPGQVAGEHADQHVGLDPVFEPVPDGPQVQVVGFDVPEVAFEAGQVLVGGDCAGGVQGVFGDGGADDVDPVGGCFGADGGLVTLPGQLSGGDGEGEVLGDLALGDDLPGGDLGQVRLGCGQQVLALAGALGGQDRVAAGDQPLPGVVRGADLGEVLLIEQR